MPVRRVLVFDDDQPQMEDRCEKVFDALYRLAQNQEIELEQIEDEQIVGCTKRAEVLWHLSTDPDALLIADLHSDTRGTHAANIGARLVRAVAQRPATARATRRVIWSRFNDDRIVNDLEPWAHAFAVYHPRDETNLERAIAHACQEHGKGQLGVFPATRATEERAELIDRALRELVNDPQPDGDGLICMRLVQRVPPAQIERELAQVEDARSSVQDLLDQIKQDRDLFSIDEAHGLIRLHFGGRLAMDRAQDPIRPKECDAAFHYRSRLVVTNPHDHREHTWLTEEEDALLASFLALYAEVAQLHTKKQSRRIQRIDEILGGFEEDEPPDPTWVAAKQEYGLEDSDLAYALWTMVDAGVDR